MALVTDTSALAPVPEAIGQMFPARIVTGPFRIALAEMLRQGGKVFGHAPCLQGMTHEEFGTAATEVPAQHGEIRLNAPQTTTETPGIDALYHQTHCQIIDHLHLLRF